ncbi:hypothetical protein HGRIS_006702 [Hohenbuehelia grisea]|uniref:Uncharacterized protein n=1 Tax=Hohenbuehelia grisea TaxID=104357 RepID=A0ABR3J9T3_9AGAR
MSSDEATQIRISRISINTGEFAVQRKIKLTVTDAKGITREAKQTFFLKTYVRWDAANLILKPGDNISVSHEWILPFKKKGDQSFTFPFEEAQGHLNTDSSLDKQHVQVLFAQPEPRSDNDSMQTFCLYCCGVPSLCLLSCYLCQSIGSIAKFMAAPSGFD